MKGKNWMLRCIPFVLLLIFVTIATTACGKCEHECKMMPVLSRQDGVVCPSVATVGKHHA